jgi:hypothetical protein
MYALQPARPRALEFGIYRDGDNNLDEIQELTLDQARRTSAGDGKIEFTVEDTTSFGRGSGGLRTASYTIAGGIDSKHTVEPPHDMSSRGNLARFVARTLDNAQKSGARAAWIDLVDHGGGDGGGLEADHGLGIMRSDDIAGAIADGVALHAKEHPEDAGRGIDGVVANQCLMSTLAFSSALSQAGVKFLAASPETMLAPGVPSTVAEDIAAHPDDPAAMARGIVNRTMTTVYGARSFDGFSPAAAFDVIDLDPKKAAAVESSVRTLDQALAKAASDMTQHKAILQDARGVDGMVRDDDTGLPWHADRPAIALYKTFAADARLAAPVREAAASAAASISDTVLAHRESSSFEPFSGTSYTDAAGPTVHFPIARKQIDPWKPQMSETDNAFYAAVGADKLTHALFA